LNNKFFLIALSLLLSTIVQANDCNNVASNCVQISVANVKGEPLSNMVVYLEPLDKQILRSTSKTLQISQYNKSFSPYISVSQTNQPVSFVNQDDITHHIYSVGNKNKFSFKIRAGDSNTSIEFNRATEIAMGCNIHDWMSGYLLVLNTPLFEKTNEQGVAYLNVPQHGKYKIVVWHPQMKEQNNRMTIEKQILGNIKIAFVLTKAMQDIPVQESDDDFDFLSDY